MLLQEKRTTRGDSSLVRGRIETQGVLGLDGRTIQEVNF